LACKNRPQITHCVSGATLNIIHLFMIALANVLIACWLLLVHVTFCSVISFYFSLSYVYFVYEFHIK